MKTTYILISLVATGAVAMAGSVGSLTTFQPNTKAMASEVNGNFTAVEKAVNDNAGDISTNKGKISTNENNITVLAGRATTNQSAISTNSGKISTNATAIGGKVSSVTASGGLEAERTGNDVNVKRASGYVSVHPSAFQTLWSTNCPFYVDWQNFHFVSSSSKANCLAEAPVSLPDGATPITLSCYLEKTDHANTDLVVSIKSEFFNDNTIALESPHLAHVSLPGSHTAAGYEWVEADFSSTIDPVDNSKEAYFLEFNPPDDTDTANTTGNRVGFCTIGYTFN